MVFFKTIETDRPCEFKNLENQGINVDTNSKPYFYEKLYYLIGQFKIYHKICKFLSEADVQFKSRCGPYFWLTPR